LICGVGINHAVFVFVKEFVRGLLADAFGRDATFANGACGDSAAFSLRTAAKFGLNMSGG